MCAMCYRQNLDDHKCAVIHYGSLANARHTIMQSASPRLDCRSQERRPAKTKAPECWSEGGGGVCNVEIAGSARRVKQAVLAL